MILSELFTLVLIPTFFSSETGPENTTIAENSKHNQTTSNSTLIDLITQNFFSENESRNDRNGNSSDARMQDGTTIIKSLQDMDSESRSAASDNYNELNLSRSGFHQTVLQPSSNHKPLWYWPSGSQKNQIISTTSKSVDVQFPGKRSVLECGEAQTEYNGQCYNVLQQLPCPTGQWLIEDDISKKGKCVENKCSATTDTAFFDGQCIKVRSTDLCRSGMRTYVYKSGAVECDCVDGYLYNEEDGKCYEAFRQGPCRQNQYFGIPKSTKGQSSTKPSCVSNPCFIDGYFCNAPSCPSKKRRNPWAIYTSENLPRNCVQFGSPCTKDGRGLFAIHPDTNSPFCQEDFHIASRIIGNVPTLKCAPGSRRDILGNCRTPTTIDFS